MNITETKFYKDFEKNAKNHLVNKDDYEWILAFIKNKSFKYEYNSLLRILNERSYQYSKESYILSSGLKSHEYLDCKQALCWPGNLISIGHLIYHSCYPIVTAIGGLTMGADPIATAVSQYSYVLDSGLLLWFSIRKEPKKYGQNKYIEGYVKKDLDVLIVDDVITTGASTIKAIKIAREHGMNVRQVIGIVDRQESDGLENIKKEVGEDVGVYCLYTLEQIREYNKTGCS